MFSLPERRPDQSYYVSLVSPLSAGVRLEQTSDGIVATLRHQSTLSTLQRTVLTELATTKSLFKNPPTIASLELITPRWGCIEVDGVVKVNPFTHIELTPLLDGPSFVDLALVGIQISRSSIQPFFKTVILEKVPESVIDLEWGAPFEEDVEEVSDLGLASSPADATPFVLQDPAVTERKKEEAKERIRAAFRTAEQATRDAERMASEFYDAYDLSDNESAFSEWMEEESSEGEAD